jgi:hypothetical protein
MTFTKGLKEWWNDPERLWSRRFPNSIRTPTLRGSLCLLVGIGLVGAVKDYILGQSLGVIIGADLTFALAGLN